jgi:hypothetical protein
MALIFMDGFDHYGPNVTRLRDGVYAQTSGAALTNLSRTDQYACAITPSSNNSGLRRVLPAPRESVGVGFAFWISQLPYDRADLALAQTLSNATEGLMTIAITATGSIIVRTGSWRGPVVGESSPEVVTTGAYQHFEAFFGAGGFEVRINGVTVVSGLAYGGEVHQVMLGGCMGFPKTGGAEVIYRIDDAYCWDDTGGAPNSWIGDKRVYLDLPDQDGSDQDWIPNVAKQAYEILRNVPPVDTEFVEAAEVGDRVSVGIAALPATVISIVAIQNVARVWKSDVGDAKVKIMTRSDGQDGDNGWVALTSQPRWFQNIQAVDPATDLPWLPEAVNNSEIVLERYE